MHSPDDNIPESSPVSRPAGEKLTRAQWSVIALAMAMPLGAVVYRILFREQLGHTAALFLGLPAILAILLALTPRAKSATGGIVKGITLFLLIVAPLLGEGALCILVASPLFLLVGVVVGLAVDWVLRRRAHRSITLSCVALVLFPLCLEGVVPAFTPACRSETVAVTRIVPGTPADVEARMLQGPDVRTPLPGLLRIGFPRPLRSESTGLAVGDTRTVGFSAAEGNPPGDLVLRVTARTPSSVRFDRVSDSSKLRQWLIWDASDVSWQAVDASHTRVTASITFDRNLDPGWYFAPWERGAVRVALGFLIAANAKPHAEAQR